jgi:hypothetical protein
MAGGMLFEIDMHTEIIGRKLIVAMPSYMYNYFRVAWTGNTYNRTARGGLSRNELS